MVPNEKFHVQLKPAIEPSTRAGKYAINYLNADSIDVQKCVMMDHVQIVCSCLKIVKHVLVEKQQWIINNERHASIRYIYFQ